MLVFDIPLIISLSKNNAVEVFNGHVLYNMVLTIAVPFDLFTALSLLFFYHKLAAKNRHIQQKDGGKISIDGLVNESHYNDGLI